MKQYAVVWAVTARDDLAEIIEYIALDGLPNALAALDRIEARARGLETAPLRGRVVPELRTNGITAWRELVVAPWRILYRVEHATVNVVALVDSRRELADLLLARFLRAE